MNRQEALACIESLKPLISPYCERIEIAGSIRRGKTINIKDIELVCIPKFDDVQVDMFTTAFSNLLLLALDDMLRAGVITTPEKCWGEKHRKFEYQGLKIDLYSATSDNWGLILAIRTGDADFSRLLVSKRRFNIEIGGRTLHGLMPSQYQVKDGSVWEGNRKISIPDEATLFDVWGIDPVEPTQRSIEFYPFKRGWQK